MHDLFASDYGELSASFFSLGHITNAAELIRGESLSHVLSLSAISGAGRGTAISDWELFLDFCRAVPLLSGHLDVMQMRQTLCELFDFSLPFNEENASALWHAAQKRLEEEPLAVLDLFSGEVPWLCGAAILPSSLPSHVPVMLLGNALSARVGDTLDTWRARIEAAVCTLSGADLRGAVLRLPMEYSFVEPNPHNVAQALSAKREGAETPCVLLSQLARELSLVCRKHALPLTIESSSGTAVLSLLRYLLSTVGLPQATVCVREREVLTPLAALAVEGNFRLALRVPDFPTAHELSLAMESFAARYPIGRARLVVGADLRHSKASRDAAHSLWREARG